MVENESIIALDFQLRLEERGYQIKTVSSEEMALKEIQNKKYHLIIIDVSLNGRKDGILAAMQIRNHNANVPIFFVSVNLKLIK